MAQVDYSNVPIDLDVLIVGAGFAGLYQLDGFRKRGYSVKVVEAGSKLGGIWYWNCYPGARVDLDSDFYQFSREDLWREWSFSERFPSWQELRAYFQFVDEKLDLKKDIVFNARMESAEYDRASNRWFVTMEDGHVLRPTYVVLCTGFAAKAFIPDIPGLKTFSGPVHHTAHWPQAGLSAAGKRVGVIGTGASGIQVIQEFSQEAAHLTVFQRTPNTALPMRQKKYDHQTQQTMKGGFPAMFERRSTTFSGSDFDFMPLATFDVSPEERRAIYEDLWRRGGFHPWVGGFNDLFFNEDANRVMYNFWREKVHARVKDPNLAEKLAPAQPVHPFGVKRPSLEQRYYEVYNQPNVELIDLRENAIAEVVSDGLVTADGVLHELDILILATGFDAVTGGLVQIDIRGTQGQTLKEKWAGGVRTHLGVASVGFPNLLFVYGPQSPGAMCIGPVCAELQGQWIIDCIDYMTTHHVTEFEVTPEAEERWNSYIEQIFRTTLFDQADSWYLGANVPGKKRQLLLFPGGVPLYLQEIRQVAENGYSGFALREAAAVR